MLHVGLPCIALGNYSEPTTVHRSKVLHREPLMTLVGFHRCIDPRRSIEERALTTLYRPKVLDTAGSARALIITLRRWIVLRRPTKSLVKALTALQCSKAIHKRTGEDSDCLLLSQHVP
jgi:hypothetical protein